MKQYQELLQELLDTGVKSSDRTGTGTFRKAGHMMRFNLQEGLPLVTTKKVHTKSVIHELLWLLSGETNIKYLQDNGVTIWDEWADEEGELGPVYGRQWRNWRGNVDAVKIDTTLPLGEQMATRHEMIDQIEVAVKLLQTKPDDRGIIVSAWNVADLPEMALRPCHCMFQVLAIDGKLNLEIYQRSCDVFLGLPFNIASYAMLCTMFAQQAGLEVGDLIWVGGDVHLYQNHVEQAKELLSRSPMELPTLELKKAPSIFDYKYDDFKIINYNAHPAIPAPVAI